MSTRTSAAVTAVDVTVDVSVVDKVLVADDDSDVVAVLEKEEVAVADCVDVAVDDTLDDAVEDTDVVPDELCVDVTEVD